MARLYWNLLTVAAALIALALYGHEQRKRGAAEVLGAQRQDAIDSLTREIAAIDRTHHTDTVRLWRTLRSLDTMTVTVEQWKRDTVRVVEYVTRADSAARACTAAELTCEERVRLRDQRFDSVQVDLRTAERQQRRPWTSAGLAYDPVTGKVGAYLDRDVLWRLRLGVTASGDGVGVRAGVRW